VKRARKIKENAEGKRQLRDSPNRIEKESFSRTRKRRK